MFFYIQFQAQLRRIRPKIVSALEDRVTQAIKNAGGEITVNYRWISAFFNENSPGFWLDILILLETTLAVLGKVSSELYGYTVIVGQNLTEDDGSRLIRAIPIDSWGTEIWCSSPVQKALNPYMLFDAPLNEDSPLKGYARLNRIRTFSDTNNAAAYPLREKIEASLKEGTARNVLLVGPGYQGKRDGLYRFCLSNFEKPLVIRFGSGGTGLCCFSDALNSGLRSWLSTNAESQELEELDTLGAILFRARFQHEYPNYILEKGRRFLNLLANVYIMAAMAGGNTPVFILEDLQKADAVAGKLFIDLYRTLPHKKNLHIYGTWSVGKQDDYHNIKQWESVFFRILSLDHEIVPVSKLPEMPPELWEIAYAMGIFLRYFPASLLVNLFEETGKKAALIHRAFSLFAYYGIIDFIDEPRLRIGNLVKKAEEALGERKEPICRLVRNRLLALVQTEKIRPCFNILKVLFDLNWEETDELILKALQMDIIHGTFREIEEALKDGSLNRIAGQHRVPSLKYIYKTSKTLIHGSEKEIREAFSKSDPEDISIPGYRTQILMNRANYLLGIQDIPAAVTMIKEVIMQIQGQQDRSGLAQAYRLFSLASLSSHRMSDAVDYSFFAIENAKKNMDFRELGLIYFYAAEIQFLIGNIFKAESLAREAEEASLNAGRFEWAERIRFFQGRLRFETGRYQDALNIFESMQNNPSGYKQRAVEQILSAWIYRTNIYLRNYSVKKPEMLTGEGLFFQLEAAYLTGDYERAVKYSEFLPDVLEDQKFLFIEQPDWDGAYTQCELFIIPKSEFFFRIGSVFRALALCRLKPANGENKKEALRIIRQIVQDERLFSMDPNDAFYFYAYYLILKESEAGEIDMNTIISIAFKRLQRRANQIDNGEIKHSFLFLHYWNNALYLAAREHKLI
jgi:tetratricopeptide (TPR) repeat protein